MGPETPAAMVDRYLQLCEDRSLDEASGLLAPGARLVFPGGTAYDSLEEMVAGARGGYRWVRKRRDHYIEGVPSPDGRERPVVSLGTLYGEDLEGRPFSGVRYVDVFIVRDGLIAEQHVFNDLPEAGIIRPARA